MEPDYITPEVKAIIGSEAEITAWDEVERGAVRRFVQAVMDPDPIYWDDDYASTTKFGSVIAPPLYPLYTFRYPPDLPDPLEDAIGNPEYHGSSFLPRFGLPEVPVPLQRILNGGNEIEFLAAAKPGDRLTARSRIEHIYQKIGRSGPMVFVTMTFRILNQNEEVLLINRQTSIRR